MCLALVVLKADPWPGRAPMERYAGITLVSGPSWKLVSWDAMSETLLLDTDFTCSMAVCGGKKSLVHEGFDILCTIVAELLAR